MAYLGAASVCHWRFPAAHHRLRLVISARRIGASRLCRGTISNCQNAGRVLRRTDQAPRSAHYEHELSSAY